MQLCYPASSTQSITIKSPQINSLDMCCIVEVEPLNWTQCEGRWEKSTTAWDILHFLMGTVRFSVFN